MSKFKITVGSLPNKNNLVADIIYENIQVAEISNENEELIIQIYCYKDKDCWEFSLVDPEIIEFFDKNS
ncbi:MAG: hypothetical protein AMS24_03805 [Chlamydiae bacterium SM23_39]|nr:MAG: hypothetical protein AMS24_03805 [Chlamydiae bacterium SM23_39]